jgi:acyl carrier protein
MTLHSASTDADLRALLGEVLGLSAARTAAFTDETPLFGALPELDSMAVAGLLTALEDRFGFILEDDEIDGDLLETFGALRRFVAAKRGDDGGDGA